MPIIRALLRTYYAATHTADVEPTEGPATLLSALPVLMSTQAVHLVAGRAVAVQMWSDIGGIVLGPYSALPTDWNCPNDLTVTRDLQVNRNAHVDGTLHADGALDSDATIHADGDLDTDANLIVDGTAGFGTATPQANEPYSRLTLNAANATALMASIENSDAGQVALGIRRLGTTPTRWYIYIPASSTNLRFYNVANRVTITADGLLGVGTIAPAALIEGNNAGTTAAIADFKDNGASVFKVDDGSKIAFFGVTTVARQAHTVDADGTLADLTTKFNALLAKLEAYGLLATS